MAAALALHLAGTGDHGFSRRLVTALPLVSEGIAALILESPYYGRRRPIHQVRVAQRAAPICERRTLRA
jgi:hypothetical protein